MAGLISQNVKGLNKKANRNVDDEADAIGKNAVMRLSEADAKTKKKRKQHNGHEEQKEVTNLENLLFGSLYSPVKFGNDNEESGDVGDHIGNGSAVFVLDQTVNSSMPIYEENVELLGVGDNEEGGKERKPVWEDEEEMKTSINIAKVNKLRKLRKEEEENVISGSSYVSRLRAQHVKLNSGMDWALPDSQKKDCSSDEEENGEVVDPCDRNVENVDDILRGSEDLVVKSGVKLLPGLLEYSRLVDANAEDPSNAAITSVQFHRNSQLILAGGL